MRLNRSRVISSTAAVVTLLVAAGCGSGTVTVAEPATDDTAVATSTATDDTATSEEATDDAAPDSEEIHVVASTTWTGAFAQLAGATDIEVIAPTSVLHPPDYEPTASDLAVATEADVVVYAEFESFAPRLVEAAGADPVVVPLTLENTAATIEAEVLRLAEELGTEEQARANLADLLPEIEALGTDAATHQGPDAPVIVAQAFMGYWAEWAGVEPAGQFGPAPMSAGDLAELTALSPTLVFDNHHLPGGAAFEAEGTPRIELINYPGEDLDLLAVFQHNHDLIVSAFDGEVTADPDAAAESGSGEEHSEHEH